MTRTPMQDVRRVPTAPSSRRRVSLATISIAALALVAVALAVPASADRVIDGDGSVGVQGGSPTSGPDACVLVSPQYAGVEPFDPLIEVGGPNEYGISGTQLECSHDPDPAARATAYYSEDCIGAVAEIPTQARVCLPYDFAWQLVDSQVQPEGSATFGAGWAGFDPATAVYHCSSIDAGSGPIMTWCPSGEDQSNVGGHVSWSRDCVSLHAQAIDGWKDVEASGC